MRKDEIVVGATYSNGKGRRRRVVGMGPQCKPTWASGKTEWLSYDELAGNHVTERHNITLGAFASWAKERIEEGGE